MRTTIVSFALLLLALSGVILQLSFEINRTEANSTTNRESQAEVSHRFAEQSHSNRNSSKPNTQSAPKLLPAKQPTPVVALLPIQDTITDQIASKDELSQPLEETALSKDNKPSKVEHETISTDQVEHTTKVNSSDVIDNPSVEGRVGGSKESILFKKLNIRFSGMKLKLEEVGKTLKKSDVLQSDFGKASILTVFDEGMFDSGSILLNKNRVSDILDIVPVLQSMQEKMIIVEGHTDNFVPVSPGVSYKNNLELSAQRAEAVAKILELNGVKRQRIRVIGFGDTEPVASNSDKAGRSKNRRVQIKLASQ